MRHILHAVPALLFAAALGANPAPAAEVPVLKSGLWEVARTASQQPGQKHLSSMCLDQSTQVEMREFGMGMARDLCSRNETRVEGDKVISSATCQLGTSMMNSRSVMTLSGNSAYRTEISATYDPPLFNMKESTTVLEGKWVGPCKPGQQPGDVITETGQTFNMKQMLKK